MKYKRLKTAAVIICCGMGLLSAGRMAAAESGAAKETAATEQPLIYGIGSTSKAFTAAAVMKLADEGQIDLDQSLTTYIPEFYLEDPRYQDITPRMLLNHSSGIQGSSLSNTMLYGDNESYHHDTLLTQLSTQRLKADPGEYHVYCNDGFTLAEILVERVSGLSFTEYLEENFWAPMGLENMGTSQNMMGNPQLAKVYYDAVRQLPNEFVNVIGSGGIYGSAKDLSQAGQMFVRNPAGPFRILSDAAVREMEQPAFTPGYGMDPEIPSFMGYGMGWDAVQSSAFLPYGIQALTKGGDTSNYHASLTVLPELNISCAVVSSGGSSSYNDIAVKEIILTYLEETGQLPGGRKQENSYFSQEEVSAEEAKQVSAQFAEYSGYYIGPGLFQISFTAEGHLLLRSIGTKRDSVQEYAYVGNAEFMSLSGNYISGDGRLVSAESGQRGVSKITLEKESDGLYIGVATAETFPALGDKIYNIPLARQYQPREMTADLTAVWKERDGKEYFLCSEKYTSATYLNGPIVVPKLYEELPGYIGEKANSFINEITDQNNAEFFQKLPGQFGRDLVDICFYEADGKDYLDAGYRYIAADSVPYLTVDTENVTIGTDGSTVWYRADSDWTNRVVTVGAPKQGHFYIYTEIDDNYTCVFSSILGDDQTPFLLPQDARIAFVGDPGAIFQINTQR